MNWLDVVLLIILACSVFTSFRKGFSREVIGLVSVLLALLLGIWFYGTAGSYLIPYVSSRSAANFGGFLLVFCGVTLAGSLVSFVVGKFLKVTGLSIFDHALGALFGAVRGIVISVALIMAILAFSPGGKPPDPVVQSRIAPYVTGAASLCAAIAPNDLKEGFHKTYAQVKDTWHAALNKRQSEAQSGKGRE
ncbi:Colicin V production protein [Candidatus Sulfopaludibacter sp. SbA3]|nr:Colicin V production protein [Candidatus Sulfopaludibacter sp. SbA3]